MTAGVLRVLTWNVHSCIGTDGRLDPERVREHIRSIDPDIAALQEVDSRRDGRDGFELLGNCLGGHRAESRTIRTADGHYGHMLLSRWPISSSHCHDIRVAAREPRSIIEASIETELGKVNVLSTHLGLGPGERRRQARKIRALAEADKRPTIVMGDFNEPTGFGSGARILARTLRSAGRRATFPSFAPLFPLDRIWFEPSLELLCSGVYREARRASDHLPLWADFRRRSTAGAATSDSGS